MKHLLINNLTNKSVELEYKELDAADYSKCVTITVVSTTIENGVCLNSYLAFQEILDFKTLFYDNSTGAYLFFQDSVSDKEKNSILSKAQVFAKKTFPYNFIDKQYNSYSVLSEFQKHIKARSVTPSKQANLFYTFGVEFETSAGIIPEYLCFQNGLIPVYDGSITGIEYASVVLKGKLGLQTLRSQFKLYEQYSKINSDCSIHVHLGDLPKSYLYAYFLNHVCYLLQDSLRKYIHQWVFNSSEYKNTEKDYAKQLSKPQDFADYYSMIADQGVSNLRNWTPTSSHCRDKEGTRKWNIYQRYYWLNVINLLYYNKNKTIEFRCLPSTTNVEKLIGWIYIFNAIAKYAETIYQEFLDLQGVDFENNLITNIDLYKINIIQAFIKSKSFITNFQSLLEFIYADYFLVNKLNTFLSIQSNIASDILNTRYLNTLSELDALHFKNFSFEKTK